MCIFSTGKALSLSPFCVFLFSGATVALVLPSTPICQKLRSKATRLFVTSLPVLQLFGYGSQFGSTDITLDCCATATLPCYTERTESHKTDKICLHARIFWSKRRVSLSLHTSHKRTRHVVEDVFCIFSAFFGTFKKGS